MRFQIKATRVSRSLTVDFPIHHPDEEFVGLIDVANSPVKLKPIIETAWKGFKSGVSPELCELGVGGTYFMHDELRKPIGVFKPHDEEPFHLNNPKGYNYRRNSIVGLKEGIQIGEAAIRECLAFMIDHSNFAGVPATDLVLCHHPAFHYNNNNNNNNTFEDIFEMEDVDTCEPTSSVALVAPPSPPLQRAKLGSFQEFVKHDGDCEDLSRKFIEKFPVHEVHKICQLDIRIFNADRHGGNILYRKYVNELQVETYQLIPIDHGYALPSTLDEAYFAWLTWPQAKVPMNQEMLNYIDLLNVDLEIQHLKEKFEGSLREEHYRVLRITTMLLKKSAKLGLSFYDIAIIACRHNLKEKCKLEIMCDDAITCNLSSNFFENLSTIMDRDLLNYKLTGDKFNMKN